MHWHLDNSRSVCYIPIGSYEGEFARNEDIKNRYGIYLSLAYHLTAAAYHGKLTSNTVPFKQQYTLQYQNEILNLKLVDAFPPICQ